MKKSHKSSEFSDRVCEVKGCDKRLKLRRVEEHDDKLCYDCHQRDTEKGKYNRNKAA